jgi:hypothetical protein
LSPLSPLLCSTIRAVLPGGCYAVQESAWLEGKSACMQPPVACAACVLELSIKSSLTRAACDLLFSHHTACVLGAAALVPQGTSCPCCHEPLGLPGCWPAVGLGFGAAVRHLRHTCWKLHSGRQLSWCVSPLFCCAPHGGADGCKKIRVPAMSGPLGGACPWLVLLALG